RAGVELLAPEAHLPYASIVQKADFLDDVAGRARAVGRPPEDFPDRFRAKRAAKRASPADEHAQVGVSFAVGHAGEPIEIDHVPRGPGNGIQILSERRRRVMTERISRPIYGAGDFLDPRASGA